MDAHSESSLEGPEGSARPLSSGCSRTAGVSSCRGSSSASSSGCPERDGLTLVRADLFDPDAVADIVAAGERRRGRAAARSGEPRGWIRDGRQGPRDADQRVRGPVPAQSATDVSGDAGGPARDARQPAAARSCASAREPRSSRSRVQRATSPRRPLWSRSRRRSRSEYKNDGIRCNAILPSTIDTPANRSSMPNADHEKWVKPAEIAGVVAHLLSPDSGPTSGAAIPVYGRA